MNVNVPPDAVENLFTAQAIFDEPMWTFGRWRPKCQPGDLITFRLHGNPIAQATCAKIERPGNAMDTWGSVSRRGWGAVWDRATFEDLR